jgi:class 3 adenylate cyclase
VLAVIEVAAGQTRRLDARFPAVGYLARPLRGPARIDVPHGACTLRVDDHHIVVEAHQPAAPGDRTTVVIVNQTDRDEILLLERRGADAVATRGTDIMTMPEFVDLYGTEAPATGSDLTIGSVAVLFSDLTRTTELYSTVGDARAFSLIQEHFRQMAAVVASTNGAILKTMGDAVMASFASPGDAVRAARHMIEATRSSHGGHGLRLKVGVHAGPCVMVRANQRMDLFGSTVNTAWRLQEQASADQLVMLHEMCAHPEVAAALADEGLTTSGCAATLKGIGDDLELAVVTVS